MTDPGALSILEKCLRAIDAGDQSIAKLWMTAARARPQDADLQENWMMVNFDAGDWRQAQSVWTLLLMPEAVVPLGSEIMY